MRAWFLDARTLELRGKLVAAGPSEEWIGRSWGMLFAPDGKRYLAADGLGNVLVWDVGGRRLERTLAVNVEGVDWRFARLAVSPDGTTLAIAWNRLTEDDIPGRWQFPNGKTELCLTLVDLVGKAAPKTLAVSYGMASRMHFSPDGRMLALCGVGAVHLFDLKK